MTRWVERVDLQRRHARRRCFVEAKRRAPVDYCLGREYTGRFTAAQGPVRFVVRVTVHDVKVRTAVEEVQEHGVLAQTVDPLKQGRE